MNYLLILTIVAASYFVEWIPNNATATTPPPNPSASSSPGEFPWQL